MGVVFELSKNSISFFQKILLEFGVLNQVLLNAQYRLKPFPTIYQIPLKYFIVLKSDSDAFTVKTDD